MKTIALAFASILLSSAAMAQTIPPVPNTSSLGAGLTQLRNAGSALVTAQAPVDLQFNITGGRSIIEAGTGPNGILGNNPVHFRNLGTIQGHIPN